MKHNIKAALKKLRYGVYVYGNDVLYASKGQSKYTDSQIGRVYTTDIEDVRIPHAVMTHIREKKINDILSSIPSGINNSILIIAPYTYSVLSALLLLKTDDPSCITYTVKGIRGSSDLTLGESGFSTLHRVPIVGLFEDAVNTVILHCKDKNSGKISDKKISIKMPNVLKNYDNISIRLTKNNRPITADEERFYAVSGGYRGSTCIIDSHANVRGFLARKPQYYGIYHLDNGRFLFAEHFFKRPTFGVPLSVVTHEMDWLGRHHHTYLHERGYHHHAEAMDDKSFLTLSSSFYDTYVENQLIRIDRKTGEEIYTLSMNELFDDTYKTRNDWCHINCISKTSDPNEVVVCMRNIHTIAKIDLANKKLIWIFANPRMYEGTAQEDLVLRPEGDIYPWFFQQHAARVMDNYKDADPDRLYISFYDNHDTNRRPVDWYDGPGASYGLVVSVDEKNKTVRLEKR
ncbi:MAG: aryl-sulfate sulfotransferase, partial [Eubacterium sp.]|nr:aryl-sulfate sulfotransferase [Eubacterium sp.]